MNTQIETDMTALSQLLDRALHSGVRRLAVAGAASEEVLKAVDAAARLKLVQPLLIGKESDIRSEARRSGIDLSGMEIRNAEGDAETALIAARLADENEVDILMKGNISTPVLLKAALSRDRNLANGLLSHVALMEVPAYHKLFAITDSGVVVRPTLDQKIRILHNAITVMRRLGRPSPNAAILAANEKVSDKMPETVDAVELVRLAKSGEFGEARVEGPMAFDIAFSPQAAKIKHFESVVSGNPDILLVPDVASGNILAKGLVYLAGARIAGIVTGGRKPIVLISRAERAETWLASIALSALVSE
jgi:phosphate butyryltransferase